MRPAIPTQQLVSLTMDQLARRVDEQQQEIDRMQLYNNELLIENERLRRMYPAWMQEFAVRYDAVGDADGRRLGAPSFDLRKAMARMLLDSHLLGYWEGADWEENGEHMFDEMSTRRRSMSGVVMCSIRWQDGDWIGEVREEMSERGSFVVASAGTASQYRHIKNALDRYAVLRGWHPLGVDSETLSRLMQPRPSWADGVRGER